MKKIKVLLTSALVMTSILAIGSTRTYADNLNTKQEEKSVLNSNTINESDCNIETDNEIENKKLIKIDNPYGVNWDYNIYDESVARVKKEDDMVWSVIGLKEGITDIEFYENYPGGKSITYAVKVDSNLNVTFEEKKPNSPGEKKEQYSNVTVEGNKILINYENALSSMYNWQYEIKDNSVAEIQKKNSFEWIVKGLKEGSTEIKVYDQCPGGKSGTYVINVDSDLNVTVKEKAKALMKFESENPLAGDNWIYKIGDESVVEMKKEDKLLWSIKGLKEGTTEVEFQQEAPYGKSVIYVIKVDSDLNVTVGEKIKTLINIPSNSTRYNWQYKIDDDSVAEIKKDDNVWSVKGLKEGTTDVTFYSEATRYKSVIYIIDVDSDLNVKVKRRIKSVMNLSKYLSTENNLEYSVKDESVAKVIKEDDGTYSVMTLKEGSTEVTFYENCIGGKSVTYIVNVDPYLNIKIEEKESNSDNTVKDDDVSSDSVAQESGTNTDSIAEDNKTDSEITVEDNKVDSELTGEEFKPQEEKSVDLNSNDTVDEKAE